MKTSTVYTFMQKWITEKLQANVDRKQKNTIDMLVSILKGHLEAHKECSKSDYIRFLGELQRAFKELDSIVEKRDYMSGENLLESLFATYRPTNTPKDTVGDTVIYNQYLKQQDKNEATGFNANTAKNDCKLVLQILDTVIETVENITSVSVEVV